MLIKEGGAGDAKRLRVLARHGKPAEQNDRLMVIVPAIEQKDPEVHVPLPPLRAAAVLRLLRRRDRDGQGQAPLREAHHPGAAESRNIEMNFSGNSDAVGGPACAADDH